MNNISRNNHFVAQMYLEAWENSNNKVWTYDLLVPNENCNLWSEKSTKSIASLHKHEWKIIDLDDRVNIPTSDDPVICLNYYADDTYDFGGGWNNIGSEIIFPISPKKIIYTKVGEKDIQFELNYELSMKIKTMIVEHAHRRIFSMDKERWITKVRKRYVNLDEFQREKEMIENWHKNYKNIESEYLEHKLVRRDSDETRRL